MATCRISFGTPSHSIELSNMHIDYQPIDSFLLALNAGAGIDLVRKPALCSSGLHHMIFAALECAAGGCLHCLAAPSATATGCRANQELHL